MRSESSSVSHQALLAALDSRDWHGLPDARDVARIRALIDRSDPWSRQSRLHVTGSALVIDPVRKRVLLRWHERQQAWLQVGGHADEGETDPWETALREAAEETGLTDLAGFPPSNDANPVQVVVVPVPARGDESAHEHADIRYVLATSMPEQIVAESDRSPIRWLDFETAMEVTSEENLRECLRRVAAMLVTGSCTHTSPAG